MAPIAVSSQPNVGVAVVAVGIDVSKDKLDVQLMRSLASGTKCTYKQFPNSQAGFAKLLRWVEHLLGPTLQSAHFCLEATGAYSQGVATFLAEEGKRVSVVNPYLIKRYGEATGMLTKNDKADARVIADYCRTQSPALWQLCRPQVRTLVALLRRLGGLEQHLQEENNRFLEPGLIKPVESSIKKTIRFLEREIASLKEEIRRHIDSDTAEGGLKESQELLLSIPGIGETLSTFILAELPDVSALPSACSAAAYAGLSPREHKSGTSVDKKARISKKGNARLRAALYMPALSAFRHNPLLRALHERLTGRGVSRKAAVCAVMRKLLMLAYGVLKSRQPFQLDWAEQHQERRKQADAQRVPATA